MWRSTPHAFAGGGCRTASETPSPLNPPEWTVDGHSFSLAVAWLGQPGSNRNPSGWRSHADNGKRTIWRCIGSDKMSLTYHKRLLIQWMPPFQGPFPIFRLFRLDHPHDPTSQKLTRRHIRKGLQLNIDTTCNLLKKKHGWSFIGAGAGQWFFTSPWNLEHLEIGSQGGHFLKKRFKAKRTHTLEIGH